MKENGMDMACKSNTEKVRQFIDSLLRNTEKIKYGHAGIDFKIHEGKIVSATHSVTEMRREDV
jgi:hypothetical protein